MTRFEASWEPATPVRVLPGRGSEPSLRHDADGVTVWLSHGAALAVTHPDGTSSVLIEAAPGAGWPRVVALTLVGVASTPPAGGSAPDADETIDIARLRASLRMPDDASVAPATGTGPVPDSDLTVARSALASVPGPGDAVDGRGAADPDLTTLRPAPSPVPAPADLDPDLTTRRPPHVASPVSPPSARRGRRAAVGQDEDTPRGGPPLPHVNVPSLLVEDADGVRVVALRGTLVVGRTPSVTQVRERDAVPVRVAADGVGVSHSHVAVRRLGGVTLVRDLWSTNGTRVRSRGVPPFRLRDGEEVPVSDGTSVELGDGVVLRIAEGGDHGA